MTGLITGRSVSRSGNGVDWISAIARRGWSHHHWRRRREVFVVLICAHGTVLGRGGEKCWTGGRNATHPSVLGAVFADASARRR